MSTRYVLAVVIGLVLVLAGCADDGDMAESPDPVAPIDPAGLTLTGWQGQSDLWQDQVLAAFERDNPEISVEYRVFEPVDYDAKLDAAFAAGTAGDIIGCRGYDWALDRFRRNHLVPVDDVDGLGAFSQKARSPWSTDDGLIQYCVPGIANITGFFYNTEIFDELGLEVPETDEQFIAVLQAVADDGRYLPLALGLADVWVGSALAYENIGPNSWGGERGRLALIARTAAFTDPEFIAPFEQLARWAPFLPNNARSVGRIEAQHRFLDGEAAIAPAGSWEVASLPAESVVPIGVFPPPVPRSGAPCFITDHPDLGFGLSPDSANTEAARVFLEWTTTTDFASAYMEAFPGLFTLRRDSPEISNTVAQEVVSWRDDCESTPRLTGQILSRSEINMEAELAETSIQVLAGEMSPVDAARYLQQRYEATR